MIGLTRRQDQLLQFIASYMGDAGVAPSCEEMKEAIGLKSKGNVHKLLKALEQRGYVRRIPKCARAIELIQHSCHRCGCPL